MGIDVEAEHTKDKRLAREIAIDHLSEDPRYYTKLKTIHKEDLGTRHFRMIADRAFEPTLEHDLYRTPLVLIDEGIVGDAARGIGRLGAEGVRGVGRMAGGLASGTGRLAGGLVGGLARGIGGLASKAVTATAKGAVKHGGKFLKSRFTKAGKEKRGVESAGRAAQLAQHQVALKKAQKKLKKLDKPEDPSSGTGTAPGQPAAPGGQPGVPGGAAPAPAGAPSAQGGRGLLQKFRDWKAKGEKFVGAEGGARVDSPEEFGKLPPDRQQAIGDALANADKDAERESAAIAQQAGVDPSHPSVGHEARRSQRVNKALGDLGVRAKPEMMGHLNDVAADHRLKQGLERSKLRGAAAQAQAAEKGAKRSAADAWAGQKQGMGGEAAGLQRERLRGLAGGIRKGAAGKAPERLSPAVPADAADQLKKGAELHKQKGAAGARLGIPAQHVPDDPAAQAEIERKRAERVAGKAEPADPAAGRQEKLQQRREAAKAQEKAKKAAPGDAAVQAAADAEEKRKASLSVPSLGAAKDEPPKPPAETKVARPAAPGVQAPDASIYGKALKTPEKRSPFAAAAKLSEPAAVDAPKVDAPPAPAARQAPAAAPPQSVPKVRIRGAGTPPAPSAEPAPPAAAPKASGPAAAPAPTPAAPAAPGPEIPPIPGQPDAGPATVGPAPVAPAAVGADPKADAPPVEAPAGKPKKPEKEKPAGQGELFEPLGPSVRPGEGKARKVAQPGAAPAAAAPAKKPAATGGGGGGKPRGPAEAGTEKPRPDAPRGRPDTKVVEPEPDGSCSGSRRPRPGAACIVRSDVQSSGIQLSERLNYLMSLLPG
jgi:hypothetical protein